MRGPSAADVVRLWEAGAGANGVERGLLLLAAATPGEAAHEDLASISLGERDRRVLTLRERIFGRWLPGVADCPRCGVRLQFTLDVGDLRSTGAAHAHEVEVTEGDLRLRVRSPNSYDLAVIADCDDATLARRVLAERCIVDASAAGVPVLACDLADATLPAVAAAMSAADPGADLVLDLRCEACAERWPIGLDIVRFVWQELEAAARRLLNEVHELAWAYGWAEGDILAMTDARRRHYLALVR